MRGKRDKGNSKRGEVIIRKDEPGEEPPHGGAWKVAYADFVTAMMAFFLLMWLLNATTEEQRRGLADYFAPTNLFSHGSSGVGLPFGGRTAFEHGSMVSDRGTVQLIPGRRPAVTDPGEQKNQQAPVAGHADHSAGSARTTKPRLPAARPAAQADAPRGPGVPVGVVPDGPPDGPIAGAPRPADPAAARRAREIAAFEAAAAQITQAVRSDPALAQLAQQLAVDITPEGLRIQIMDAAHRPMFALGSAEPNARAQRLLRKVAPVLVNLGHSISIAGHTDAAQYPGPNHTNWELSTERANATRRLLVADGFPDRRILSVTGHADRELLLPAEPLAPANRRIAIVVPWQAQAPPAAEPPHPATSAKRSGAHRQP